MRKSPLFDLAAALPEHLAYGVDAGRNLGGLPQRSDIDNIVILGMGAARTAGQVVRALSSTVIPVPILVESSYEIPACVGKRSLVYAISGSGNTDEVNHTAAKSAAVGAQLIVVTVGGWLVDFARDRHSPVVHIPPDIQPARAAFGVMVASLLTTLGEIGFLPEAGSWVESAVLQLRRRHEDLCREDNVAKRLASVLIGRHVLCQGDTPIGATAAERWKAQINQNAKQCASSSEQPNASHNEAVAWDSQDDRISQNEVVVLLRHAYEDPRVRQRIDRLAGYLNGKVPVHSVHGEGDSRLAVLMDLVMLGDFTSLQLAAQNGVDPCAIPFISETLKEGLAPPDHGKQTVGS
jgi:glucose/mannose-6-phosphate isomerase